MTNPLHTTTKQQRTRLAAPGGSSRARFGPKHRNMGENKEPKHSLNEKRNNLKNKETKTRKCQYQKMQGYITKTEQSTTKRKVQMIEKTRDKKTKNPNINIPQGETGSGETQESHR